MKKIVLILLLFLIGGMVSAYIITEELSNQAIILTAENYMAYAYAGIAFKELFWSLLYERGKMFLFLAMLSMTPFRTKILPILVGFFVFGFGFFFMTCILELGIAGVVVGVATIFPQMILYGIAIFIMYQKKQLRAYRQQERMTLQFASWFGILLLFVTGCILECMIGVKFIPWIIRLSLV